ncbi:ATP-binding protein [Candidatus Woesearchaeota archaeon]|nr:ATP-binding protein [Candidatus Woesearchaeota archaeon]
MSEIWYRKLGFYNNPFSIKPARFHDELIAYDLNYIYKKIDNGEMLFIDGTYGTGKTTILKNIINRYRGRRRVVYYNYNKGEKKFDIRKLLRGANSFVNRVIGLTPKNVILLLDEITNLNKSHAKSILGFYNSGNIKSVIFVNHDYYNVSLPDEIEEKLDGNIIRTAELSSQEAVDLVRRRIGNIAIISDSMIKKIFLLSDKNPRKLLENCEDICRYAVDFGDDEVIMEHVKHILGLTEVKKKPKQTKKEQKQKKEQEPEKKRQSRFKKNKLLEATKGQTIVPKEVLEPEKKKEVLSPEKEPVQQEEKKPKPEEPVIAEEKKITEKKKIEKEKTTEISADEKEEPKEEETDKETEDVPEYNIVFYNE